MKKILFIILFALLSACTAPPTAMPTQTPSPTLVPTSTPTPLPPTPDLSNLILSGETLSTADDETPRYTLTDTDWEPIPPEELTDKLSSLEGWDYTRRAEGNLQIIDFNENPLWLKTEKFWTVLPEGLPEGFIFNNPNENPGNLVGAKITTEQGTPSHAYFQREGAEEGEWIKDFPRVPEIRERADNPLTLEDFESGKHLDWLNSLLPEILAEVDWDNGGVKKLV